MKDAANRLLEITREFVALGVEATQAAKIAERVVFDDPWVTPEDAAAILKLHPRVINRNLRGYAFKGAKKFSGRWRIPRAVLVPELKG